MVCFITDIPALDSKIADEFLFSEFKTRRLEVSYQEQAASGKRQAASGKRQAASGAR
jgi:hypothetical protein